jgi:predicted porin
MQKTKLALAIAVVWATTGVAYADNSNVTLYGSLWVEFDNAKATGATSAANVLPGQTAGANIPSRNRVANQTSWIGFRGVEDLGGGLNAFFQVENNIPIDATAASATWASRNSAVGLNGGWGTVLFGQWDTPYKLIDGYIEPFAAGAGEHYAIFSNNVPGALSENNNDLRGNFHRRAQNSVQYWTPKLAGFSGRFAYAANEEKTNSAAAVQRNPSLYSVSVKWEGGPASLFASYEQHNDYSQVISDTKDSAWMAGGAYTISGFTLGASYERIKWDKVTGLSVKGVTFNNALAAFFGLPNFNNSEVKVNSWALLANQELGPHRIRAAYARNQKFEVAGQEIPNAKASYWALGYGYFLSKRTELSAVYVQVRNEANSANNLSIAAVEQPTAGVGVDPRSIGVAIKHSF